MKIYEKPILLINTDVSEGVYTFSGTSDGSDCYTVTTMIHQMLETGRGDYRIQVDGIHSAANGHHSDEQILILSFNQPVVYSYSNGELLDGNGTNTLRIKYDHHNNAYDNIGLGDVIVVSDLGLTINNAVFNCNHNCKQH